jgi:hypothetical protein
MCLARAIRASLLPALILAALLPSGAAAASHGAPSPLFTGITASARALEGLPATVARERLVHVNVHLLVDPSGSPRHPVPALRLNLFPDVDLEVAISGVSQDGSGSHAWVGRVVGADPSDVVLVLSGGLLAGRIAVPGAIYQVRHLGAGIHAVQRLLPSAFPPEGPPVMPSLVPRREPEAQAATAAVEDGRRIDVLVVYTPAARIAAGDSAAIQAEVELAVAATNLTYANSGIIQRLRLVHVQEVAYTEPSDMNDALSALQYPFDGILDQVPALRDMYGADVVSLIVETGNFCGLAYLMSFLTPAFAPAAFSVVARSCAVGNLTFAHELGHNMGAHHDRFVTPFPGAFPYSHGYVNTAARWRTVMAYDWACRFGCPRLAYWSNPGITYGGAPMGVPEGFPDAADNRQTLDNTAVTVANFRPTVVPHPPEVSGILTGDQAFNFDRPGRGFVRVTGRYELGEPLDLGAPGIEASILTGLLEAGGRELVEGLPRTLIPRTRSQRVTVFETPPGATPLFRLTVRTCVPELETCPNARGIHGGEYTFQVEVVNATVHRPTRCGPAPASDTTRLTTRFTLADHVHPPVDVLVREWPWTCEPQSSQPIVIRPQH